MDRLCVVVVRISFLGWNLPIRSAKVDSCDQSNLNAVVRTVVWSAGIGWDMCPGTGTRISGHRRSGLIGQASESGAGSATGSRPDCTAWTSAA